MKTETMIDAVGRILDHHSAQLRRLQRWPDRLTAFVDSRRAIPFAWGSNDCVTFCIDAVQAITGTRVLEPTWTDEASAMAAFEAAGGRVAAITGVLGRPSQNWAEARRGDIVLAEQDDIIVTMLCVGADLCGPSVSGLEFKPARASRLVWRVG